MDAITKHLAKDSARGPLSKQALGSQDGRVHPKQLPRRTLKVITQPPTSGTCGPASIAMISGCSLDQAIAAMGTSSSSTAGASDRDMRTALVRLGIKVAPWLKAARRVHIPDFCLATIEDSRVRSFGHAVAILDGLVYDPGVGWPMPLRVYEDHLMPTYGHKSHVSWDRFLPILSEPPSADRWPF
jgi:hypothetical protein